MVSSEPMRSGAAFLLAIAACAHAGSTSEKHAVKADLAQYRTCTLTVDSDRLSSPEPDASAFEDYLAGRLRDGGVLQPLEMMEPGTPDLTLRIRVAEAKESGGASDVKLVVFVVETRSGDELGELEVTGSAKSDDKALRTARRDALHHAADEIVSYLASKRGSGRVAEPTSPPPRAAASASLPPAEDPFRPAANARQPICASTCATPSSSALGEAEVQRVTSALDGHLQALRACLERVGGGRVEPAIILRFGPDGGVTAMRVDMGGFEDLLCVDQVRMRPPRVRASRESMVRCVYHCS